MCSVGQRPVHSAAVAHQVDDFVLGLLLLDRDEHPPRVCVAQAQRVYRQNVLEYSETIPAYS